MLLGQYSQKTIRTPPMGPDFTVQEMQFHSPQQEVFGEWERFIHPSGAIYYYNETRTDALTLDNSTSATIFSNKDVMEKIINRLASLDDISSSDGIITEPGVALFVRKRLNQIYVDGIVNSLDIKAFIDDFSSQNTAQITLVGVIMAVDASFLAVQGVGTGMVAESILKGSIIFCVGCIFSGMFAQHFGEKMKSLRFVAYYLDQGMAVVLGILVPLAWCSFWAGVVPYIHVDDV
ncbi:uncharacterized protein F5147DRAFT_660474 [Suillus discolor]|uniref:Uncharacterized protein n=1 Tax=Suillus discolor TaxID=1912936 RepID=A0A9P7JKM3_9AGAM|nr:uncharacterized protein F5147DRAFT_660474 [Suillus discolor]KAG2082520.1 hypothetical protein F5147DRAFT_660474 [Suillus discolor]